MKRNFRHSLMLLMSILVLASCASIIPTQQQVTDLQTQLQAAQAAAIAAQTAVKAQEATIAAQSATGAQIVTLQKQVDTLQQAAATQPSNATITSQISTLQGQISTLAATPASGVDSVMVKTLATASTTLNAAIGQLNTLTQTVAQLKTDLAASSNKDAQTAAVITASTTTISQGASLIPGWGPMIGSLVGIFGTALAAFYKSRATAATAAGNSMTDAVQTALSTGSMTATPAAAATINAVITDHPVSNSLVDVVSQGATMPATAPASK